MELIATAVPLTEWLVGSAGELIHPDRAGLPIASPESRGYTFPRPRHALIVGGTRGIGRAIVDRLWSLSGWRVKYTGHQELDLSDPSSWQRFFGGLAVTDPPFDLVVFAAGELRPGLWHVKDVGSYCRSQMIHAIGPVCLTAQLELWKAIAWWSTVCFVSSVGAVNAGAVDLPYGMAKAALEKAAKALQEHASFTVKLVRLDLVDTDTLRLLPEDTLHGRRVMSKDEAATLILKECEVES